MEYAALVDVYDRLGSTSSTLEKTTILAELFADADEDLLPTLVTLVRGRVFPVWKSADLGVSSKLTRAAVSKATGVAEADIDDRWRESGDLGDAAATAVESQRQQSLFSTTLDVETVHETLVELASYEGPGSQQRRVDAVAHLVANADPDEARYLVRTVVGAMRLGIGDGAIRDAIAEAFLDGDGATAVERAYQLTNDYGVVAETARESGAAGLAELGIELFRPLRVMLATKAETLVHGLETVASDPEDVYAEYKYDGMRVQIHVRDDETRVYTRRLEDVTAQFPDVVAAVEANVTCDEALLEGEVVAYDPDTHELRPFQELSRRIKRTNDIEDVAAEIPVVLYCFDLVAVDGESLLEATLRERLARLDACLEEEAWTLERATGREHPEEAEARSLYERALAQGHEGLMLKNLAAPYQPGSRVGYMMKLKPTMEPLDLVVTRAKYSEGRRSNKLGRLYLGCCDEESGELREVGRLATGYTDEELVELTERLEPHVTATNGRAVEVEPAVVVEVEYEEIQRSTMYDSGVALRFPRFVGFRDDIGPDGVDTLDRVRSLYESQP